MASNSVQNGGFTFTLDPREFHAVLSRLEDAGEGRKIHSVVKQAVRAGLSPVRTEARRQAPVDTGATKRTIHTIITKAQRWRKWIGGRVQTGTRDMLALESGKASVITSKGYGPAAIEYGRAAPGDAGGPKVVPPNPFMRRAYEKTKGIAQRRFIDRLKVGVDKLIAKRAGK